MKRKSVVASTKQHGVVLIVGLIMVLLMSIVAMAAIRSSGLQEAMAGGMRNRNIAFQAAESALASGEALVNVEAVSVAPVFKGADGKYMAEKIPPSNSVNFALYDDLKNGKTNGGVTIKGVVTNSNLKNVTAQPAYIAEQGRTFDPDEGSCLDFSNCHDTSQLTPFRITAIGVGIGDDSQVVLQSTYNRQAH